ncbi:hypothetical protein ACFOY2_05305 [Nonomuraea purpurea]|uniref:Uncharacterized protein n=1 Tax=Nonomuraea purpurea TaxID=1849276 RepID=A0ABV8G2N1_9ACTN
MTDLGDRAEFHMLVYIPEDLTAMADRLMHLSYATDAAADTGAVVEHLRSAIDKAARLADVWRAVERTDHGDGLGEVEIHEALAPYRGDTPQQETAFTYRARLALYFAPRSFTAEYSTCIRTEHHAIIHALARSR